MVNLALTLIMYVVLLVLNCFDYYHFRNNFINDMIVKKVQ